MFDKKGQVTIFVILGILVVIVIGVVFLIYGERLKVETEKEPEFDTAQLEPLKNFVEDCIDIYGNNALDLVAKQGGSVNPGLHLVYYDELGSNKISYLCHTEINMACTRKKYPLISEVEEEISDYLTETLNSCIDLEKFREEGFNVEAQEALKVTTSIGRYTTIINVDYPLTIRKGTQVISKNRFTKTFNLPLGRLLEIAEDIIDREIAYPPGLDTHSALEQSTRGELIIQKDTQEGSEIYTSYLREEPNYKFRFAVRNYVIG